MKRLAISTLIGCTSFGVFADADSIFYNAKVYTVNDAMPWAQAFAVKDGVIVEVGDLAKVEQHRDAATKMVDLSGKVVMPGMVDEHIHPDMGADNYMNIFVSPLDPWEKVVATLKEYRNKYPDKKWIYGGNLNWLADNGEFISGTTTPSHKSALDAVIDDRPVALWDQGAHAMLLNSLALKELGITKDREPPAGGIFVKDENGELTGVVRETVSEWVIAALDNPTVEEWADKGMKPFFDEMHSYGVTAMNDAYGVKRNFDAYKYLEDKGEMEVRMHVSISSPLNTPEPEAKAAQQYLIDNKESFASEFVYPYGIKYILDGSAAGRTAVMLEPFIGTKYSGSLRIPQEDVMEEMARLEKQGFVFKVHAIGDGSIRMMLDNLEQLPVRNDGRYHSIAHGTFVNPQDYKRFHKLNVVYEASPALWFPSDAIGIIEKDIGKKRVQYMWPIRQLLAKDTLISYGSDWTVAFSPNPWLAIESLVTREVPGGSIETAFDFSSISLTEALEIVTLNGAKAIGLGDKLGSIEKGKFADFIVLDNDIFDGEIRKLHKTQVKQTYFNGKLVYEM
ncbi:amidohydrolase [Vibrio tubiashii]|uniref:amidohydrolase n=1 Tax=Vibrio tubiashii TaxID=29498 RepID=UPI00234E6A93|nr:amidohydrolase [Vibrio tubiashii]WCP69551.1 amidohydrolase [Vibrio tubiashii]